jgi:hypothetical protein
MSNAVASYRKPICLIHGIESDGAWRDEVRNVLEPHFRCISLEHDHFLRLGFLKIFNPWLRRRAVQHVFRQYSNQVPAGALPHLIAHSFGTWISSRLMMKAHLVYFDRVIFAGSPLPEDFSWDGILTKNDEAFSDLRNEIGGQDVVIRIAGKVGRAVKFIGAAGSRGFRIDEHLVHSLGAEPLAACQSCRKLLDGGRPAGRVHNVKWDYRHSEWFVAKGHAAHLWLPYFWKIEPGEYFEFVRSCLELKERENEKKFGVLVELEERFRAGLWSWTNGRPLAEFVRRKLPRTAAGGIPPGAPTSTTSRTAPSA